MRNEAEEIIFKLPKKKIHNMNMSFHIEMCAKCSA